MRAVGELQEIDLPLLTTVHDRPMLYDFLNNKKTNGNKTSLTQRYVTEVKLIATLPVANV